MLNCGLYASFACLLHLYPFRVGLLLTLDYAQVRLLLHCLSCHLGVTEYRIVKLGLNLRNQWLQDFVSCKLCLASL
jgi:hypothetical protein